MEVTAKALGMDAVSQGSVKSEERRGQKTTLEDSNTER